jgi:hypothetical protein
MGPDALDCMLTSVRGSGNRFMGGCGLEINPDTLEDRTLEISLPNAHPFRSWSKRKIKALNGVN